MHIKISGHHITVTPAIEASILEKFARVERHFDHINSMQVVLSLDNHHSDCSHKGQLNHKAEAICGFRVPSYLPKPALMTCMPQLPCCLKNWIVRSNATKSVSYHDID